MDAKLRRKGLTDGSMTLAKLLSEGRSMEIVEKQSKGIEQALKETSINKVTHQNNDSRRQTGNKYFRWIQMSELWGQIPAPGRHA